MQEDINSLIFLSFQLQFDMATEPPLEKRQSRGRLLSKQDEVEEVEEEHSPSSETSDATVIAGTGIRPS